MHTDSGFAGEAALSKFVVFQPVPKETVRSRCQHEKKSVCIGVIPFLSVIENSWPMPPQRLIFRRGARPSGISRLTGNPGSVSTESITTKRHGRKHLQGRHRPHFCPSYGLGL
jgi:hypothetical protein